MNLLDSPDEAGAKPLSVEDALMLKPPRRPAPSTIRPLLGSFVRMLVLPSLFDFKQEGLGSKCSLDIDNIAETLDKSSLCNMIWHPFWLFLHCVYHSTDDFLSGQRLHQPCSHAAMQPCRVRPTAALDARAGRIQSRTDSWTNLHGQLHTTHTDPCKAT